MQPELLPECATTCAQLVTACNKHSRPPGAGQQRSVMKIQLIDMRLGLMLLELNKRIETGFVCLQHHNRA